MFLPVKTIIGINIGVLGLLTAVIVNRFEPYPAIMAWITDSLRSAIAAVNPFGGLGQQGYAAPIFTHQLALAAYRSSGLLRKVIRIPAEDRVREWRDWQADKPSIALIEAEEKRLGLVAKVKQAETLRGIGGGALILVTEGNHDLPLDPKLIAKGGIIAINVVSRWQIRGKDWVREFTSPDFGKPKMWEMTADQGGAKPIHPSRVICFRGEALPAGSTMGDEDTFWGDSRLVQVTREVERSDNTQAWFSELVKKAKLMRFGISNLTDYNQDDLNARVALIASGENSLNAVVYNLPTKDGAGNEAGGEKIDDYQMTWAGIPQIMDAFDQRIAAVADIPFTRLMGRSPAGMNATGAYDDQNWAKAVSAGQQLETRPCLESFDAALIKSAGVVDAVVSKVTWKWAPLWSPTEKEEADTFKTFMEALEKVQATGAIPERAFIEAFQNFLEEREYLPGLSAALEKVPEAERFGLTTEPSNDNTDPSAIQGGGDPSDLAEAGGDGSVPRRRAANDARFNDATPRSLYVQRKLLNTAEFIAWAKGQGFTTTTPADEIHCTITYSRTAVDWMKMGATWEGGDKGEITVAPGGARIVEVLGDKGAVVLLFASSSLSWRHEEMKQAGASFDFPEYQPHVTITYAKPEGLALATVEPFRGALRFGPEIFEELDTDFKPGEA